MALWPEIGAAMILAAGLLAWAQTPAPWVTIAQASEYEGQTITLTGWPQDIRGGQDWTRFVLVQDGHAIHVYASSERPPPTMLEVTGRVDRIDSRLVMLADEVQWTHSY